MDQEIILVLIKINVIRLEKINTKDEMFMNCFDTFVHAYH